MKSIVQLISVKITQSAKYALSTRYSMGLLLHVFELIVNL